MDYYTFAFLVNRIFIFDIERFRKRDLQAVHKSPIERIENDKGTGKEKARSAIDPVGDLLRRHRCPAVVIEAGYMMVGAIRQRLRRVAVERQRQCAGRCRLHVDDGAVAPDVGVAIVVNVFDALRRCDGGNVLRWETLHRQRCV